MTNDTLTRLEAQTARKAEVTLMLHARELLEALESSVSIVERYASDPVECVRRLQALMPAQCAAIEKATRGTA